MIGASGLEIFFQARQQRWAVLQQEIDAADFPFLQILIRIQKSGKLVGVALRLGILAGLGAGGFIAQSLELITHL